MAATTILLYGRTGSGKTTQIGVLTEDLHINTGQIARLYTADRGGLDTLAPYVDLGLLEVVEIGTSDPWIFLNKAVRGYIRDEKGKWVLDKERNAKIGMYAFESAHSLAKLLKSDMEKKAAFGINIGGDTNTTFSVQGDDETLKIGTTKGYQKYGIPQQRVWEEIIESQKLEAQYVLWTAGLNKGDDDINSGKVVGPDVIGNALTGSLPMDFNYTFRIDSVPVEGTKAERHIIYLGTHKDVNSGNATALGNIRRPIDAPELKTYTVEPANIVTALRLVRDDAKKAAAAKIQQRIETAKKLTNVKTA